MAELFKDRFDDDYLNRLALGIHSVYTEFPVEEFLKSTMDETWDSLAFKQRIMQISANLGKFLPTDYETAIHILDQVIIDQDIGLDGFAMFFPAFVELFGQGEANWAISMAALERYTPYASAEFAVRAFILKDEQRMMAQMAAWAKHDNEHVRRLASEGCRPRLPWGQALPSFLKDPTPVLRILEQLKNDPSPYVRKSVANNLNDISKTHPEWIIKIAREWYGHDKHADQIVKHGCRTLLKQGRREVLDIFGFADASWVKIDDFALNAAVVSIEEEVTFSFAVETQILAKVRLEYGIDFVKANGKRSRKIFQISEPAINGKRIYTKKHSLADTSTRKHYPGVHSVVLIVNGVERGTLDFELLAAK